MKSDRDINPLHVLAIVVLFCFAWRGIFIYRSIEWVTNFWLFEDFGYSLKIARNIALGVGETFDGVVRTSGYQPLYVWVMVPVFWILPKNLETPVYVAETFLAICNSVTAIFVYRIATQLTHRPWSGVAAAVLWAFNLAVARNGTLGLEAGLSTMMVGATVAYVLSIGDTQHAYRKAGILGTLLAVTFLARVDTVFLVAATALHFLFLNRSERKSRVGFLIIALAVFFVLVAPYCIWNVVHYGSPLPTSGQVTTGKSSLFSLSFPDLTLATFRNHILYGLYIIGRMLVGLTSVNGWVTYSADWCRPVAAITAIVLLTIVVFSYVRYVGTRREVLFVAMTGGLYVFAYTVYSFVPYERYFLPAVMVAIVFATAATTALIDSIRFSARLRNAIVTLAVAAPLVCFGVSSKAKLLSEETFVFGWYDGAQVLNRIARRGEVVAALQTGNTGYFYEKGRAINLDGVVNLNAYRARADKTFDRYLAENNVRYLADQERWPLFVSVAIRSEDDRAHFLARLSQVYATPAYFYTIYRLDSDPYSAIHKPALTAGWDRMGQDYATFGYDLMSATPGSTIAFSSDRALDLRFLRQDRSGIANVYRDGILVAKIDLYAAVPDTTYKYPLAGDGRRHQYAVQVANDANAASQGHEVWFDAILEW